MLTLMHLPNEILSSIIEATEPEDIESFSTCCKLMYSLARHRLEEHKEKKSLFSKLLVEDYFLPFPEPLRGAKYGNPETYLKEFFSDQRNRFYPKAMVVYFGREGVDPMNESAGSRTVRKSAINGLDELEQQLESRMAEVHSMLALDVGGIETEDWGKDVRAGYPLAIFLLLLALLPNLEECHIDIRGYRSQTLSANYSEIIRLMIEAALRQKENGLSFGGRLSKCTIDGIFCESLGEDLLPFIMMLPRMKTIDGCGLVTENGSWPLTDAVSPVVDLDLHGAIHTVTLSSYVRGIRELKRFRYTYEGGSDIHWDPCRIVATLRQFAFRSLVHLDLTNNVSFEMVWLDASPGIGSLRSFEVLETVRLQYILLFEEVQIADSATKVYPAEILGNLFDKSSVKEQNLIDMLLVRGQNLIDKSLVKRQNLIDFLPSSVRIFQLEDIVKGEPVLDTFEGFPEHRLERLPNLELISLDAGDEFNGQIEKICKEAGVQMRIEQGELNIF